MVTLESPIQKMTERDMSCLGRVVELMKEGWCSVKLSLKLMMTVDSLIQGSVVNEQDPQIEWS
jgi:hypothetical protein